MIDSHGNFELSQLLLGLCVNLALGALAYARGSVSRSGFAVGVLIGTLLVWFGGWGAFAALFAFFVLGSAATRIGFARKAAQGLAQEDSGRRGSKHAVANCATGLALALAMPWGAPALLGLGLVAAFATAASDTLGSEIGQLYGRRPFLPTTFRPVPAGTEGAVSVEGTLAGVAGSALLALLGAATGLFAWPWFWIPIVAAFAGTTFESYVGAIWGRQAKIGNEAMNFLNTVVGAAVAMLLGRWLDASL
jgi:uncharacterized protein (TIGR00297 family)